MVIAPLAGKQKVGQVSFLPNGGPPPLALSNSERGLPLFLFLGGKPARRGGLQHSNDDGERELQAARPSPSPARFGGLPLATGSCGGAPPLRATIGRCSSDDRTCSRRS
ncbi:unnamed protein product [Urochloa humidicola]